MVLRSQPPPGQNVFYLLLQLNVKYVYVQSLCSQSVLRVQRFPAHSPPWEEAEPTRMICHFTKSLEASRGLTFSTDVNVKSGVKMGFTAEEEVCCVHELKLWHEKYLLLMTSMWK